MVMVRMTIQNESQQVQPQKRRIRQQPLQQQPRILQMIESHPISILSLSYISFIFSFIVLSCNPSSVLFVRAFSSDKESFGYIPSSDVSRYLKLALDIKLMREATTTLEQRQDIYENGNHSIISLASLSLTASKTMSNVPIYNLYLNSFRELGILHENDSVGSFDGKAVEEYANTLIEDLFMLEIPRIEATAAVLHTIYMSFWSFLYQILYHCENLLNTNTTIAESSTSRDMIAALDAAVALYVGEGQIRNDSQTGYMIYRLAEDVGGMFNQKSDGETTVNTKIMNLFISIQEDIQKNAMCTKSDTFDSDYRTLRRKVYDIMKQTNIILLQVQLHYIQVVYDNAGSNSVSESGITNDFVELVALAIHPQIEACHTGLSNNITDLLITHSISTEDNPIRAEERDNIILTIQKSYSCFHVTCSDIGSYEEEIIPACNFDNNDTQPLYGSYRPSSLEVQDVAIIDRDMRQINIFLQLKKFDIAQNYYTYGWNTYFSLYDIATSSTSNGGNFTRSIQESKEFQLYQGYNSNYKSMYGGTGSALIDYAFQTPVPYDTQTDATISTITDSTRVGIISGSLETYVMWIGAFSQFWAAFDACDSDTGTDTSTESSYWDYAAAFLIGSSSESGRDGDDSGQSIFAISKRFCNVFDTCEPSGSISNTVVLAVLEGGRKSLVGGSCDTVLNEIDGKMKEFLFIPIFQGLIYYAVETARGSQKSTSVDSKGYLVAYTMTLLPYIANVNATSALILNAAIELDEPIDLSEIVQALRSPVEQLGIDCALIGQIEIYGTKTGVCFGDPPANGTFPPAVAITPTTTPSLTPIYRPDEANSNERLAWGIYKFVNETIALMDANFSYDIRDMYFSETPAEAESIYLNVSTNAVNGLYGYPNIVRLQDFSTKVSAYMQEDPVYNFFRIALFDDATFEENTTGIDNGWPYADAVEQLAVGASNGNNAQLGSKAVAVMEFYMMIIHRLYASIRHCDRDENYPDLIDAAVGLWIGREQGQGKFNSGWSIYSVAQDAADFYGRPEEEADVNTILMSQFKEAQNLTQSCDTNPQASVNLRTLVDKIVRNLSIPLLQHLLFHMSDNNLEFVELYALSFIPQTVSVDEGAYAYLRDALFQGYSWESTVDDFFLSIFGKVLHAMRFTCSDLGNVTEAEENLERLVTVLCNEIQASYNSTYIAAYETSYDVSEYARYDLDVHQIDIFLRVNALGLANDVYTNGRNSRNNDGTLNTLQLLTSTSELADAGDLYIAYKEFYEDDKYADTVILDAISTNVGRFSGYSRRQLSESIRRTLQTMAVYIPIHALLRSAIEECRENNAGQQPIGDNGEARAGQEYVDQAVALFVGSIEGPYSGGSLSGSGKMMYSLGKDMCRPFSTCDVHDDSHANIFLLFGFSSMKEYLDDYQCDEAEDVLTDSVLTTLPVLLIQGAVYYSLQNDTLAPVTTDVLAETILPQIEAVSVDSAQQILVVSDRESVHQPSDVVKAYKSILNPLGVDCTFVGNLEAVDGYYSFCDDDTIPITNTTTDIPDSLYSISTDVQEKANIALDIKQMLEYIKLKRPQSVKSLYDDGENFKVLDASGEVVAIRSIASFSTKAYETMKGNPIYHVATYALQDDKGKFMGVDVSQFADTIVKQMFDRADTTLPMEAAVALNIWMELTNELFLLVTRCREKEIKADEGEKLIDGAVAYWVGGGQLSSSRDSGYLLYSFAESIDENFSRSDAAQKSRTNINILRLFSDVKQELSNPDVCTSDPTSARRLRRTVDKIVALMTSALVKGLIHFLLVNNERDRVFIYAHAFVPLVAGCSPAVFSYLKEKLLLNTYIDDDIESIIVAIRSTFPCLGIRCEDVGTHFSELPTACTDPSSTAALADYKPSSDVHEYSKVDLDILELDILLKRNAYEAAFELYSFGKHASVSATSDSTSLSLSDLAMSDSRTIVPEYESYVKFYSGDSQYANTLVRAALDASTTTDLQRRVQIVGISQYMIMYVSILQAMRQAIESCQSTGDTRGGSAVVSWDRAAALIIGHLEGSNEGGSLEGRFFWSLSKVYCKEFDTCSDEEVSSTRTNDKITTYLFTGRGAVLDGSCDELSTASTEISSLLIAPVFQGLFSTASKLSQRNGNNRELFQTEAYVYSQILLPLINNENGEAISKTIRESFPLEGQALRHGLGSVVSALVVSMNDLNVKCQYVGSTDEIDSCSGQTSQKKSIVISGVIVGMFTIAVILSFILIRHRRKVQRNKTAAPVFKMSNGELNHHSELVCARTEQPKCMNSSSQRGDSYNSDTDLMNDASDAMIEEEEMGITQEAITKVDNTDEEYVRAISAALHDKSLV